MRRVPLAFFLFMIAVPLFAHEENIEPVKIELAVMSHQVRVRIRSDADYWLDAILGVPFEKPLPAVAWPENFQIAARNYVEKSFQLRMDGRDLKSASFVCRSAREPLSSSAGEVIYEITYPIDAPGKVISGRAQFFGEYYAVVSREKAGKVPPGIFLTYLVVESGKKAEFAVPFESPEFQFSTEGLLWTSSQNAREKVAAAAYRVASNFFFWIAAIFIAVKIHSRYFKRREQ